MTKASPIKFTGENTSSSLLIPQTLSSWIDIQDLLVPLTFYGGSFVVLLLYGRFETAPNNYLTYMDTKRIKNYYTFNFYAYCTALIAETAVNTKEGARLTATRHNVVVT